MKTVMTELLDKNLVKILQRLVKFCWEFSLTKLWLSPAFVCEFCHKAAVQCLSHFSITKHRFLSLKISQQFLKKSNYTEFPNIIVKSQIMSFSGVIPTSFY